MRKTTIYSESYYQSIQESTIASAKELIPIIKDIVNPTSVVDIGCGTGIWLSEWIKQGTTDITGVDGHYINTDQLAIPSQFFIATDLEKELPVNRNFDLVMCLEVAEHLHKESSGTFISSLCKLGNIILFSAAIPGQGGFEHINEQYPSYWVDLFSRNGYTPFDILRSGIWRNKSIDKCYRQNIMFYANEQGAGKLANFLQKKPDMLDIVHPEYFDDKQEEFIGLKKVIKNPMAIFQYYLKSLFRRLTKKKKY